MSSLKDGVSRNKADHTSHTTAPSAPSDAASVISPQRSHLKRFTHSQIAAKVAARQHVMPEYYELLMAAALTRDETGVVFDSASPEWAHLIAKCAAADANAKQNAAELAADKHPTTETSATTSANTAAVVAPSVPTATAVPAHTHSSFLSRMSSMLTSRTADASDTTVNGAAKAAAPSPAKVPAAAPAVTKPAPTRRSVGAKAPAVAPAVSRQVSVEINEEVAAAIQQATLPSSTAPSRRVSMSVMKSDTATAVRDTSLTSADQRYEQRIFRELQLTDEEIIAEWTERRTKERARRQAEAEAEEKARGNTNRGGVKSSKKKNTKSAPVTVSDSNGKIISDDTYMATLIAAIHAGNDLSLIRQLVSLIGIPPKYRQIVWSKFLKTNEINVNDFSEEFKQEAQQLDAAELTKATLSVIHSTVTSPGSSSESSDADEDETTSTTNSSTTLSDTSATTASAAAPPDLSVTNNNNSSNISLDTSALCMTLESPRFDLNNQRVIKVDLERTLPHLATFSSSLGRHELEVILTEYCQKNNLTYKQGMNYLLVPFFFLNINRLDKYNLYQNFIKIILNNTFIDDEFGSLQCLFLLFRLLLHYHDPQLALHLDQYDMSPELYASSWFLTLWSNRCKLEVTLFLWDLIICESLDDPHLYFFISLSLLIANRTRLLQENEVGLPEQLSRLTIVTKRDAYILVQRAKRIYRTQTTQTIRHKINYLTSFRIQIDSLDYIHLSNLPVLNVSPQEIISHIVEGGSSSAGSSSTSSNGVSNGSISSSTNKSNDAIKFFLLDLRSVEEYESGHLPMCYHIDPALLEQPEELEERVTSLFSMHGCHFVFIDDWSNTANIDEESNNNNNNNIDSSRPLLVFMQSFRQKYFKYLSILDGGYSACHDLLLSSNRESEIIDHLPSQCFVCSGRVNTAVIQTRQRKGMFASMTSLLTKVVDPIGGRLLDSESVEYRLTHLPDECRILQTSNSVRLLLTVLRDRSAHALHFTSAVRALVGQAVALWLESVDIIERNVPTVAGGLYTGGECKDLCLVTMTATARVMALAGLRAYTTGLKVIVADVIVDMIEVSKSGDEASSRSTSQAQSPRHSFIKASPQPTYKPMVTVTSLPETLSGLNVMIFVPQLSAPSVVQLFEVISNVIARNVSLHSLTVVAVVAVRQALWSLSSKYPTLRIVIVTCDEMRHGKIVPGVDDVEGRYQASNEEMMPLSVPPTPSRAKSTGESTSNSDASTIYNRLVEDDSSSTTSLLSNKE